MHKERYLGTGPFENEKLKAEIEKLRGDLSIDDVINRERREIFSKILGAGYSNEGSHFHMQPEVKPVIWTWQEIACEIGKIIERSHRFESIERTKRMEKMVEELQLSNKEIFKILNKNENRN